MKLGAWAFTVLAAALHAGELEFASLLAEVGGQTLEAGEALKERPRDVVHKAAERLARRIEREHRGWLIAEFGSDPTGRAEMAGMVAAIPDVLAEALSDLPAMVRADLKPQAIADLAVARIGRTDERFRPDTAGARMLRCLIIGTYAAARQDSEFDKAMARAVQEVLLERTSRLEAGQQRIEALLKAGGTPLHLLARHRLKAPPSDLRELLMTELRATDLVGREEELQSLKLWLAMARERRDISLHCLTGRAGAGKTRLAIELCEWAEYAGWSTGFVRQEELARFHEHHHPSEWRWPRPTLIVVDYAAASARVLRSWLDELARGEAGRQEAPLRILLLERHADREAGWWADLVRPGGLSGRGPDVLIDDGAPLALGPLRSDAHRRALLTQAMQLAAPVIGKSAVPLPPAGTDALFDQRLSSNAIETEPLFLIMAGVVAVESDAPAALALGRLDLGELVADAERSRLQRLARAAGADDSLTLHLAACVTLQGGCGAVAATELVEQERAALGDRSITRTDQLVGLLRELLPGQAGEAIDAVRPDLIGEAFLLKEIRPAPRQVDAVERAFRRAGRSVIGVVIRTAQDHAQGMAAHASVTWLDHLARLTDDPFALMAIAAELPEQTLALRERAAEITARIVTGLAARGATEPHLRPVHAGWTNNLANRLRELGNREAALSAAREAADLYRALATQRPDAFGPHLAGSLNTLAFMLTEQGDREAALSAAREAADLHRALAAQRPDAFRPVLAMSLNNMAIALSEMGDREAALSATREAVDIRRGLAAQRPDEFRPDLAASLNNLANMMSALGDKKEAALLAVREAADLYRALAAQRPDAFRPDLAMSLSNLAAMLSALGNREAALSAAREAVDIRRALVAQRPDAFRPNFANSLWVLAECLDAVDCRDEGVAANAEAITQLSGLFQRHKRAFAGQIEGMVQGYIRRCEVLGRDPDQQLLAPVLAGLRELQTDKPEDRRGSSVSPPPT